MSARATRASCSTTPRRRFGLVDSAIEDIHETDPARDAALLAHGYTEIVSMLASVRDLRAGLDVPAPSPMPAGSRADLRRGRDSSLGHVPRWGHDREQRCERFDAAPPPCWPHRDDELRTHRLHELRVGGPERALARQEVLVLND